MNVSSWISSVLRAVRWHRRGLAVVAAACALVLALAALSPGPGPTRTVVVSARDLAAGVGGGAAARGAPARPAGAGGAAAPAAALPDPAQIVGQLLAAPPPGGPTLLDEDVVSSSLVSASDGLSLVPFRIPDAAIASILEVGDLISVVTLGPDGQSLPVVDRVRIAALPAPVEAGAVGGSGPSGALVVVAADADQAALLASVSSSYEMGIILEAP